MAEVGIFNFADVTIEDLQNRDDFKDIKIKKRKFALNKVQRNELLELVRSTNYTHNLMISTQIETGIRVNELVNLTIDNVNFNQHSIDIRSRKGNQYIKEFKTKTEAGNRTLPISRDLSEKLKLFVGKRKTGYLFLSQKKTAFTKFSYIKLLNKYAKSCKSINQNIGSHALRRTFASFLLSKNVKIEYISRALGHSSIQITLRYLFELEPADFQDVIRKAIRDIRK